MSEISICVPTYNGGSFVGAALASIVSQTLADFELIVSDDCSYDDTPQVVRAIRDPRLVWKPNDRRLGLVGNWNRCIDLASNEYVNIFHQDDVMSPANLERKARVLDENQQVGFVFSNIVTLDSNGTAVGGHWNPVLPNSDTVFSGPDFLRLTLTYGNLVPCQTVMARSQCFRRYGNFDSRLHYTPDLEMWLRLALHYDVAYIAEPLVGLRRHPNQESARFLAQAVEVVEVWRCFQIIFTEHRGEVPELESMFNAGLEHLQKWTAMFLRRALAERNFSSAVSFSSLLFRFARARQRGVYRLVPLAGGT